MQRSLLLLLLFCAGCSTMKDVGVGMRAGGGFGGVGLLGSIIEATADLGGGAGVQNNSAEQAEDKKQKDAIFEAVVSDFITRIKTAEQNNTMKSVEEEAKTFCSSMEKQISTSGYSVKIQKEENSVVSYSEVTLLEDPFDSDCKRVMIRRGKTY